MKFIKCNIFNFRVFVFLIVFVSLCSCGEHKVEYTPKRNILFYVGADENNTNADVSGKINYIRMGWQPGKGELIIYVDRLNNGACLLRVNETKGTNGYYGLDTIQTYGTENSADASVVSRVINKFVNDYPADSYGMIFFSHGSGWLPQGTLTSPRSLVIDKGGSQSQEMEVVDFASAIPDKQFDFIILEACLMSDVVTMYELRNKAEYVLASSAEIVSPGFSFIYKDNIMTLFDTKSSVSNVVTSFAQSYYDYLTKNYKENNVYCSTTLSLVKMDEMETLASVTKTALQGATFDETSLSINNIQNFDRPGVYGESTARPRYFDFEQTMDSLVSTSQAAAVKAQIEKTVVNKWETKRFMLSDLNGSPYYSEYNGFFINHHCGLTTYIEQSVFPYLNSNFENSDWYNAIH